MKLKFGMIVTDAVNKIGGHVVSKNHFGRFARTYIVPADPHSTDQQARRAIFRTYSLLWQSESLAHQNLWRTAAGNYPRTDSLGNIYYPSGQNLYIELNSNLVFIGQAAVHVPPAKVIPTAPPDYSLSISETAADYKFTFVAPYVDATVIVCIKASISLSTGINYISTQLRNFMQITPPGPGTTHFRTQYIAKFGAATVGKRVFLQLYAVNKSSGSATFAAAVPTTVI